MRNTLLHFLFLPSFTPRALLQRMRKLPALRKKKLKRRKAPLKMRDGRERKKGRSSEVLTGAASNLRRRRKPRSRSANARPKSGRHTKKKSDSHKG